MAIDIGFLIKNIISALLMPLTIGLLFGIIALWYLHKENIKKAKIFLFISLVWIALLSYRPLSYFALEPLETRYSKVEFFPKEVHYILLIGGDKQNRTWEGLRLYHKIPNAKIVTSGYKNQAQEIKTLLIESGIPEKDIFMQTEPKDTKEEAIAIKKRLGNERFFLVTSAYHMPRSIAIFKTEGLNPIPAPTDFQDANSFTTPPKGSCLAQTERAWHEYLGELWVKIKY